MEGTYDHSSNPDGRVCCLFSWVLNIKGFFSTAILSNILIVLVNIIKAVLSFHAKNCFTYLFCLSVFFYPPKHTSITNIKNLKRGGETVWEESTLAKIYMKFLVEKEDYWCLPYLQKLRSSGEDMPVGILKSSGDLDEQVVLSSTHVVFNSSLVRFCKCSNNFLWNFHCAGTFGWFSKYLRDRNWYSHQLWLVALVFSLSKTKIYSLIIMAVSPCTSPSL